MKLAVEISAELHDRLVARAEREGTTPDELVARIFEPPPTEELPVTDEPNVEPELEGPPHDRGLLLRDRPPKPCLRRFAPGRWCTRDDGHDGDCDGPPAREHAPPNFMPRRKS